MKDATEIKQYRRSHSNNMQHNPINTERDMINAVYLYTTTYLETLNSDLQ